MKTNHLHFCFKYDIKPDIFLPLSFIFESNWTYYRTMDTLAENFATNFIKDAKFKLAYDVNRHHSDMVIAMEAKNQFTTAGSS